MEQEVRDIGTVATPQPVMATKRDYRDINAMLDEQDELLADIKRRLVELERSTQACRAMILRPAPKV